MGIETLAALSIGISVVSAIGQYESGQHAASAAGQQAQAQKDSIAAQKRLADVEAQRARITDRRAAIIARGRVIASSYNSGMGAGTSGMVGATSSISSQEGANVGAIGQAQTFAAQAGAANQRVADAGAAMGQAGAQAQQWQTINTIFGSNKTDFTTIFGGNKIKGAGSV